MPTIRRKSAHKPASPDASAPSRYDRKRAAKARRADDRKLALHGEEHADTWEHGRVAPRRK
jgi:hypothetical protein